VLIFNSVLKLGKSAVKDRPTLVIALVVMALAFLTDLSPVVFVLLAAIAGLLIFRAGGEKA
jgi:chromate transporter